MRDSLQTTAFGRQRMRRRTPHLSHRVPSLDKTSRFSYMEGTREDNMHTRFVDTWTRGTSTGQVVLWGEEERGRLEKIPKAEGGLYRK